MKETKLLPQFGHFNDESDDSDFDDNNENRLLQLAGTGQIFEITNHAQHPRYTLHSCNRMYFRNPETYTHIVQPRKNR